MKVKGKKFNIVANHKTFPPEIIGSLTGYSFADIWKWCVYILNFVWETCEVDMIKPTTFICSSNSLDISFKSWPSLFNANNILIYIVSSFMDQDQMRTLYYDIRYNLSCACKLVNSSNFKLGMKSVNFLSIIQFL